jgi:cytochrome b
MDGRSLAWLGYVPVPGLFLVPVLARPDDRLARYHAWQSGLLVGLVYVGLTAVGLLAMASDAKAYRSTVGFVGGLLLLAGAVQLAWGGAGAARGRFPRLRPAWDLAAMVRKKG